MLPEEGEAFVVRVCNEAGRCAFIAIYYNGSEWVERVIADPHGSCTHLNAT